MDFATVIGFIASIALFSWALVSGAGEKISGFWDTPSFVLVICGAVTTTLLSVRLERFLAFLSIVRNAFFSKVKSHDESILRIVRLAETARREGILSLQSSLKEIDDKFVSNGLQLVIDGTDPETIKKLLEYELAAIDQRHAESKQVIDQLGKYGPAYGMIGTLVGLVCMLQNMDDPKKIGPGMAVAILTTLYGAVLANVVCLPLADKLNNRHAEEALALTIAQEGILGIQSGDNPRVLLSKLSAFLPSKQREKLMAAKAAA